MGQNSISNESNFKVDLIKVPKLRLFAKCVCDRNTVV